jgi:hypothetical protein
VTGEEEGSKDDQQNPFEGLVYAGERGADGHQVILVSHIEDQKALQTREVVQQPIP